MDQCRSCNGFLPRVEAKCLHCGAALPEPQGNRSKVLVGAMAAMTVVTLMACYGAPECIDRRDEDKDGSFACVGKPMLSEDCADNDATRRPGFPDPEGDGIDQNCDGVDGVKPVLSARGHASAGTPLSSVPSAPNDASAPSQSVTAAPSSPISR
jgi:hypothetical protein